MQDGFIFSDTIINNIAPGEEEAGVETKTPAHAVTTNIRDFIRFAPLGIYIRIGMEGNIGKPGASNGSDRPGGVYKNPAYLCGRHSRHFGRKQRAGEIMEQLRLPIRTDGGDVGASAKRGTWRTRLVRRDASCGEEGRIRNSLCRGLNV